MLVLYRTRNPFLSSAWTARPFLVAAEGDDHDVSRGEHDVDHLRRIEDAYHDEPSLGVGGQATSAQPEDRGTDESGGRGPVVQPSRLQNEGNEWREA